LKYAVERSVYRLSDQEQQIARIAFDPFDSPFRLRDSTVVKTAAGDTSPVKAPHLLPVDLKQRLKGLEQDLIKAALERAKFNQRVAANLLGLSYHQFRGKIRKHSLDVRKPG
jgi:psp operon transcriptional activator